MIKRYSTRERLNPKQAEEVYSRLIYSIENVAGCYLEPQTQDIVVDMHPECDEANVDETVSRLIDKGKNNRIIGHRTLMETEGTYAADSRRKHHDIETVFSADGTVRRGFAVLLKQRVDALMTDVALRHGSQLRGYPSKIALDTLNKCGYLSSFPQNIHLVSEVPHMLKDLERARETGLVEDVVRLSPYALSPAVCFHCYAELAGQRLDGPVMLTAAGQCHRHEAHWRLGHHRLNEFTMREIVLFGESDHVEAIRRNLIEEIWNLFCQMGLAGKIENASDPFYYSEDSAKGQHQLMGNMKFELIADLGHPRGAFSIASFNHMGDSLCKPFEVHDKDDRPMNSGCIAFGIDRFVYALLASYGAEPAEWPSEVKKLLNLV